MKLIVGKFYKDKVGMYYLLFLSKEYGYYIDNYMSIVSRNRITALYQCNPKLL
jgi:hypothetical protein